MAPRQRPEGYIYAVVAAVLLIVLCLIVASRADANVAAPRPEVVKISEGGGSRGACTIKNAFLHTTEGPDAAGRADLVGLGNFFYPRSRQANSTVANDREGNDARYTLDSTAPWTQVKYNCSALSIEQIGYARTTRSTWLGTRKAQLQNTAHWLAYWHERYAVPLRRCVVAKTGTARTITPGVCQHADAGPNGGGHWDSGPGYPTDYVLDLARKLVGGDGDDGELDRNERRRAKVRADIKLVRDYARRFGWEPQERHRIAVLEKRLNGPARPPLPIGPLPKPTVGLR